MESILSSVCSFEDFGGLFPQNPQGQPIQDGYLHHFAAERHPQAGPAHLEKENFWRN